MPNLFSSALRSAHVSINKSFLSYANDNCIERGGEQIIFPFFSNIRFLLRNTRCDDNILFIECFNTPKYQHKECHFNIISINQNFTLFNYFSVCTSS